MKTICFVLAALFASTFAAPNTAKHLAKISKRNCGDGGAGTIVCSLKQLLNFAGPKFVAGLFMG